MRFIIPSVLVLAAAVPAFAAVDSGLLALVPSSAKVISGIDVSTAKSSPFGQYMLNKMSTEDAGFQQMLQETGFDPRRDVESVLFVSSGADAALPNAKFVILVRGNFDQSRVQKSLVTKGATAQMYQGTEILVNSPGSKGTNHPGTTAFSFADVDIAVMGDLASVEQVLTNRSNPSTLDPTLTQLVTTAGTNHDAWFASINSGSFLADHMQQKGATQPAGAQALQSILQSSGGVSFGNTVDASFDAAARSDKDATAVADVVRFGVSMVQMQRQADPRAAIIASSLDNMTLQTSGSNVHISLSLPESGLEQLAALNPQSTHQGMTKSAKPLAQ